MKYCCESLFAAMEFVNTKHLVSFTVERFSEFGQF